MNPESFFNPEYLRNLPIHLIGIKGTGMTALAEILKARGACITGSDVAETFYTDSILARDGIKVCQGFSAENIPDDCRLGIRSAAWNDEHVEVQELQRRGIPLMGYTEALGEISRRAVSCAVSGVHGKTSTTAIIGSILKETDLPFSAIVGSGVSRFDGRSTWIAGDRYLVAETCEYRRHFLSFHPDIILLTSVEIDHMDYFRDYSDIESAFLEFGMRLPDKGIFVFCSDDPGASQAAEKLFHKRRDIRFVPYGENIPQNITADNRFQILDFHFNDGESRFRLSGFHEDFILKVPGKHMIQNAAGALAAAMALCEKENNITDKTLINQFHRGLSAFNGTRRRSEIIGRTDKDIIIMDDYGHHPTAIKKTLHGLREFYPGRKIVVDFMSHTYSRTRGLLESFSRSFNDADTVILNKIYPSARELSESDELDNDFFRLTAQNHPDVRFIREPENVPDLLDEILAPGDLFITMGAGNNWIAGTEYLSRHGTRKTNP